MTHIASTMVLFLIAAGIYFRRRPQWHFRLMVSAFLIDLSIVVYLEATRQAVKKVTSQGSGLLWFHVAVSVLVLVAYVIQIMLGSKLLSGVVIKRQPHLMMGISFCVLPMRT